MEENRLDSQSVNIFKPNNFDLGALKQNTQVRNVICCEYFILVVFSHKSWDNFINILLFFKFEQLS